MRNYFGQQWQALTIKRKIATFTGVVFVVCALSLIFDVWIVKFSLVDFNQILEENSISIELVQSLEAERSIFMDYVQNPEEVTLEMLEEAMENTQNAVDKLPYDYEAIGEVRYSQTWSIWNVYEVYRERRSNFLEQGRDNPSYINDLYEIYDIQAYLIKYANNMMTDTLE